MSIRALSHLFNTIGKVAIKGLPNEPELAAELDEITSFPEDANPNEDPESQKLANFLASQASIFNPNSRIIQRRSSEEQDQPPPKQVAPQPKETREKPEPEIEPPVLIEPPQPPLPEEEPPPPPNRPQSNNPPLIFRDLGDIEQQQHSQPGSSFLAQTAQRPAQNTSTAQTHNPPSSQQGSKGPLLLDASKDASPSRSPSKTALAPHSDSPATFKALGNGLIAIPNDKNAPSGKGNETASSAHPTAQNLGTLIADGKLANWTQVRQYFGQMLQIIGSLKSQNVPQLQLTPSQFSINSQGKVLLLMNAGNLTQSLPGSLAANGASGVQAGKGQSTYAFSAGLILFEMSTGKNPDAINPASGKSYRQEIQEGKLSLPLSTPDDVKQILTGLLQSNAKEHTEIQKALMLLTPALQAKPELTIVPSLLHLKAGEAARPSSLVMEEPIVVQPLPASTLFINNSITPSKPTPAKNTDDEEEESEEGPSILAVVFGSEDLIDASDEALLALISSLKGKKIKMVLIAQSPKHSLFDLSLNASEIGLHRPYLQGYEDLIKILGCPAKEILFIDKNPENVKNAKILGMNSLAFVSSKELRAECLKRNLI